MPEKHPGTEPAGKQTPVTRYATPFNLAFGTELGFFPWLELPENERRLVRFGHGMVGTRQFETKDEILRGTFSGPVPTYDPLVLTQNRFIAFSWDELRQGAVVVDVGGGIGAQTIVVAEAYPDIRVVVEDREQVVATARSVRPPCAPCLRPRRRV